VSRTKHERKHNRNYCKKSQAYYASFVKLLRSRGSVSGNNFHVLGRQLLPPPSNAGLPSPSGLQTSSCLQCYGYGHTSLRKKTQEKLKISKIFHFSPPWFFQPLLELLQLLRLQPKGSQTGHPLGSELWRRARLVRRSKLAGPGQRESSRAGLGHSPP